MNPSTLNQLSTLVRHFRIGLLCLLVLNFQTYAATVTWSPVEITGAALSCRMYFVPTNIALNSGNNLNLGQPKNIAAGTTNTTLLAGDYTVSSPDAPFRRPFLIAVPDDANTYSINALRNPPVTYTYTNRLSISGLVLSGTGTTFVTNNAGLPNETVTISASAGGGSTINTNPFVLTNDTRALVLTNSNNLLGAASVNFNTGLAAAPYREGRVFYDTNSHTLSYYLDRSNVTPNLGFEMLVRVLNTSGATISNGAPVTLSTQGNGEIPRVVLAQSTTNLTSAYDCIGIATEDILQGEEGIVAQGGIVHDVNTDNWQNNSTVYVSTNAGVLTTNPPPAGYEKIRVGVVAKSGSNSGHILVAVRQSLKLSDIANVGTAAYSNSTAFVGTNAWAATNALKADLANLTIAATNSGAYVAATNGTAYNLNISSGNGGGLTNLQATNIVGGNLTIDGSFFFTNEFIYTPKTLSAEGAYSDYAGTYSFAGITWYESQYGTNSNGKVLAWDYLNRSGIDLELKTASWVLFNSVGEYLSGALPVLRQDSEINEWVTLQSALAGISPTLSESPEPEDRSFKRAASQSENSLWLQNKDFFVEAKLKSGLGLNLEVNTHEMPSYNPAFAGAYFLLDVRPQFQGLTIYNKEGNAFMHKYSIVDGAYESASGVMWDSLGTITAPATKTVLDATGGASSVKTVEGDVFYPHTVDGNLIWTTSP
jgi:hypothetical protein